MSPDTFVTYLPGRSQDGSADWLGKLDRHEKVLRVKVIVARLVDDPNLAVLRSTGIRDDLIDLSTFQ